MAVLWPTLDFSCWKTSDCHLYCENCPYSTNQNERKPCRLYHELCHCAVIPSSMKIHRRPYRPCYKIIIWTVSLNLNIRKAQCWKSYVRFIFLYWPNVTLLGLLGFIIGAIFIVNFRCKATNHLQDHKFMCKITIAFAISQ